MLLQILGKSQLDANFLSKISLVLLFALSLILVGITVYRVQGVTVRHSSQQFRSLLASAEILAAAAVSNALVLGSFVRDRGAKKQRFRFGSTGGHSSIERTTTAPRRIITARTWGSDADLVGDLGMRLDPELTEKSSDGPRPAPTAIPASSEADVKPRTTVDQDWTFPNCASVETETEDTDLKSSEPLGELQQPSPGEVPSTPRGMSFFDVGGLLGDHHSLHLHSRHHSVAMAQPGPARSFTTSPGLDSASVANPEGTNRRGSHVLLQDIGGLVSPSPRAATPRAADPRPEPSSQNSGLIEALQSSPPSSSPRLSKPPQRPPRASHGLQDVGGLLS